MPLGFLYRNPPLPVPVASGVVARRTGWALSTEEAPTAGARERADRVANMAVGKRSTEGLLGEHAEMLFVAEVTSALLIGRDCPGFG